MLVAAAAAEALVNGTAVGGTSGTVGAPVSIGVPGAPSGPTPPVGADAVFREPPPAPVPLAVPLPGPPGPLIPAPPPPPGTPAPAAPPPLASLDVTVVELTCRLPDDLRPLDEPPTKRDLLKKKNNSKSTNLLQANLGNKKACKVIII